ncbi:RES family NAD+ phosphorylase [Pseudomonas sp. Marseille-QA0332]
MNIEKTPQDDVNELIVNVITTAPSVLRTIQRDTQLYRVQKSKRDSSPIHYERASDSRYADPAQRIGVKYLAGSDMVAIAESFQGDNRDQRSVQASDMAQKSLHCLQAARDLRVVDVTVLAARSTNSPLYAMVKTRYDNGYELTRQLSHACMQLTDIDGLIYPSAVLSPAGLFEGCNLVLFENRQAQLRPVHYLPVLEVELSTGETAKELLNALGVTIV